MSNTIVVEEVKHINGGVTITGKKENGKLVTLTCDADSLYQSALQINNESNKTKVTTDLFKLSDIPKVMKIKGWNKAAHLNEKWLNSSALAMLATEKGTWSKSNQELDYYNPYLFNHEWLSKFERYNDAILAVTTNLMSRKGQEAITQALFKDNAFDKLEIQRGDNYEGQSNLIGSTIDKIALKKYHNNWQTQRSTVDNGLFKQAQTYLKHGIDDLWASFGAFALYAGIGEYSLHKKNGGWYEIVIHSIFVYAIDSYDFIVDNDEHGNDYLGHWSKTDFDFFLTRQGSTRTHNIVVNSSGVGGKFTQEEILYPIFNSTYEAYRKKYSRGGDMVIWTKPLLINIRNTDELKKLTKADALIDEVVPNDFNTAHVHKDYIDSLK